MGDKELELKQLIERALALADELHFTLVGVRLDEARQALSVIGSEPSTLLRLRKLIGRLPNSMPGRLDSGSNVVALHGSTSLERLIDEHEALETRRKSLLKLVEGPPNTLEAERQLVEFGALILSHRALERRCVYGPLMAQGVDDNLSLGVRLSSFVQEIENDWNSYLHAWDRQRMADHWIDFALTTHRILARAGERMQIEEEVVYPLAFVSGIIQLREAAG